MTDEKLKQKAKAYRESRKDLRYFSEPYKIKIENAYIAGAKENGVVWHNLRKNPNDLPDDTYDVLDQAGYKVHYNFFQNVWMTEKDETNNEVIAWCELPKFEECE